MKRRALEDVIKKHIGDIEKYSNKLPGCFDEEDIHDLRVGYKKARAFVRLLQLQKDTGQLHIPHTLRSLYHHCGKVRDMQLYLTALHTVGVTDTLPVYMRRCQQQLFTYKEQTVCAVEDMSFKKILKEMGDELPRQLQDDTPHKFIQHKIAAIHIILLAADGEKELHDIRKQVKDIVYNIRIYEDDWGITFPVSGWWGSEKKLSDLASRLGDFNDQCIALSLLQSGYCDPAIGNEKHILQELENNWRRQKETRQQQLLQQMKGLQMEYA